MPCVDPTVMRFVGREREVEAKKFFRKEGWGWHGQHRVFTAQDGKEYKWFLGAHTCWVSACRSKEDPAHREEMKQTRWITSTRKHQIANLDKKSAGSQPADHGGELHAS